ncbi:MAG: YqaA family protein [Candidatus Latescibacteria bacterium]|nr:YqaA family protein [Candidatus Latescibacterota bacterium]
MIDAFHSLSDWVVAFADSDWAILVLAVEALAESIFFPIPPDPLLVLVALLQQHLAILLALMVTVASVAGAVVGHWLGGTIGRPLLDRWFSKRIVDSAEGWLGRYGVWATIIAAFTPIPYKVFAITAGVLDMDRRSFILASIIGRGARFMTIGVLVMVYGERIEEFIGENFELVTVGVGAALIAALAVVGLAHRLRTRSAPG